MILISILAGLFLIAIFVCAYCCMIVGARADKADERAARKMREQKNEIDLNKYKR